MNSVVETLIFDWAKRFPKLNYAEIQYKIVDGKLSIRCLPRTIFPDYIYHCDYNLNTFWQKTEVLEKLYIESINVLNVDAGLYGKPIYDIDIVESYPQLLSKWEYEKEIKRQEKERLEKERQMREQQERERRERLERERLEREREEREYQERLAREFRERQERLERERLEREREERERQIRDKKEYFEKERLDDERRKAERKERKCRKNEFLKKKGNTDKEFSRKTSYPHGKYSPYDDEQEIRTIRTTDTFDHLEEYNDVDILRNRTEKNPYSCGLVENIDYIMDILEEYGY